MAVFIDALIEAVILFGVIIGGMIAAGLLILAAVAVEYYVNKWRAKK